MGLFFLLGLVFVISPLFGAICSFIALYFCHDKKYKSLICFFYLGLFLGLINALKVPESDLENYIEMYVSGHNLGFVNYVFSFGKEPVFMVFNYLIYEMTSGSVALYLIIFTVICYMLIFYCIWIVHNRIKLSSYSFIYGDMCSAFFSKYIFIIRTFNEAIYGCFFNFIFNC